MSSDLLYIHTYVTKENFHSPRDEYDNVAIGQTTVVRFNAHVHHCVGCGHFPQVSFQCGAIRRKVVW